MQEYLLNVPFDKEGTRLDLLISAFSKKHDLGLSRTSIQSMISKGKVSVNGSFETKPHDKVKRTDKIKIIIEDKIYKKRIVRILRT